MTEEKATVQVFWADGEDAVLVIDAEGFLLHIPLTKAQRHGLVHALLSPGAKQDG